MMTLSDATSYTGLTGAFIAGYAYLPQITHITKERCSAGISRRAFLLWLVSSALMTVHALAIRDTVFIVLGVIQLGAIGVILFYAHAYEGQVCPSHRNLAEPPVQSTVE